MSAGEKWSSRGPLNRNHSLPIFLSYGHDANEELVGCIYADLKKRGHDDWFDKTEIKFGDEWRRTITGSSPSPLRGESSSAGDCTPLRSGKIPDEFGTSETC